MAKFVTSARTVDMLGRQQIAGIPTAISELFKNAYDAYATSARVDYYEQRGILTLRDNGIGMSLDDFETRWLTLGTSSKVSSSDWAARRPPPVLEGAPLRPVMGEKGIGRLAIASLGSQTLVLTRAQASRPDGISPVTVALIPWSLFQIPGLLLDEIELPLRVLDSAKDADRDLLASLRRQVEGWVIKKADKIPYKLQDRLLADLQSLDFEPNDLLSQHGPSLLRDQHGTTFIVTPISDDLPASLEPLESSRGAERISPLEKLLVGFTDTMSRPVEHAAMVTRFVEHGSSNPIDILAAENFWGPRDFMEADHQIKGRFDEYGAFVGTVSVYGGEATNHVISWPTGATRPSRCGPFELHLGYVQGNLSDSRIEPDRFAEFDLKLRRIGGLYVYRDGLRVQPYGDSSVDYLRIEERRSRSAGRYYFSYRRMFGAIRISIADNPALQDKASREGLRENAAFRDFRDILENFLVQLARDFFRASNTDNDQWKTGREQARSAQRERLRLEAKNTFERAKYLEELTGKLADLESASFARDARQVLNQLEEAVKRLEITGDPDLLSTAENDARQAVSELVKNYSVAEPTGLGLDPDEVRERFAYERAFAKAVTGLLPGIITQIVRIIDSAAVEQGLTEATQENRIRLPGQEFIRLQEELEAARATAVRGLDSVKRKIETAERAGLAAIKESYDTVARRFITTDPAVQQNLITEMTDTAEPHVNLIRRIGGNLDLLGGDDGDVDRSRLLQEQVLDLQRQADNNVELLLLGQAVQIIDHELDATTSAIRSGLKRLRSWAPRNKSLAQDVEAVAAPFQHLDSYLRILTPLQRRLNRQKAEITGTRIANYVGDLFEDRCKREGVQLRISSEFRDRTVIGFPSTIFAAFVNLVDNAIYWSHRGTNESAQFVLLSADDKGLTVSDSGPGVSDIDDEIIFQRGFSRRPGGRGLGLTIARQALLRDGFELELVSSSNRGAQFRIRPLVDNEEN